MTTPSANGDAPRIAEEIGLVVTSWIFRLIVAINFAQFGLSFWPRFEGTATEVGIADRIFGNLRLGGFRIDFVWLVLSTLLILAAGLAFLAVLRGNRRGRVDALLAAGWVVAFVVWIIRLAMTNQIDFG